MEKVDDIPSCIADEKEAMVETLIRWASVNTHTLHREGIDSFLSLVEKEFIFLGDKSQKIALSPWRTMDERGNPSEKFLGDSLLIRCRREASHRILFAGHMDTVYPEGEWFETIEREGNERLVGPGVTDMKGGLVVLLYALRHFSRLPASQSLGWDILLTSDEEIGSPGSTSLFRELAKEVSLALLFEPALADGSLVSERPGSANYLLLAKGHAAHVGRDIEKGKNALFPLVHLIEKAQRLHAPDKGQILNVGTLHGGISPNVVPEHASCRINIRFTTEKIGKSIEQSLLSIAEEENVVIHRESYRPPKPLTSGVEGLLSAYAACGEEIGETIRWRASGGVCDGNIVAAAGIPTLDTLGVVGNMIHQKGEYVLIDSLVKRTQVLFLFLHRLATGEISWPHNEPLSPQKL